MGRIVGSRVGQSFQGMGRNSLLFFVLGSVASAGGRSLMAVAYSLGEPHHSIRLIGLVYTAAAVVGMFAVVDRMGLMARATGLSTENRNTPAIPLNSLRPEADGRAAFP